MGLARAREGREAGPAQAGGRRLRLTHEVVTVHPKRTFRIAVSADDEFHAVVCRLEHDGVVGYGEASPTRRVTGEDVKSVGHFLDWAATEVADLAPAGWERFLDRVHDDTAGEAEDQAAAFGRGEICGNPSARCALDLAVHDLVGKLDGVPARSLYGLPGARLETSMTVSLDEPDVMADEARGYRTAGFRCLKLKLGRAERDLERVEAVRRACPDARLRADANTAWTEADALRLAPALAKLGVEFVEQPLHPKDEAALVRVSQASPLPVYADESVHDAHDVRRLHAAGFRGGMNVKLMKAGGIRPALAALRLARELGYQTQLGCNVETAIGISGAAQLLSVLDHADLDGHLLLRDDPFRGIEAREGWYETPDAPGLGVAPRS